VNYVEMSSEGNNMVHDSFLQEMIRCVRGIFHDFKWKLEIEKKGERKVKIRDEQKIEHQISFRAMPKESKTCKCTMKNEKRKWKQTIKV